MSNVCVEPFSSDFVIHELITLWRIIYGVNIFCPRIKPLLSNLSYMHYFTKVNIEYTFFLIHNHFLFVLVMGRRNGCDEYAGHLRIVIVISCDRNVDYISVFRLWKSPFSLRFVELEWQNNLASLVNTHSAQHFRFGLVLIHLPLPGSQKLIRTTQTIRFCLYI